jgi:hypothetical protein
MHAKEIRLFATSLDRLRAARPSIAAEMARAAGTLVEWVAAYGASMYPSFLEPPGQASGRRYTTGTLTARRRMRGSPPMSRRP